MKLALLILIASPAVFAQVRVEPRSLVKERRFFLSGGLTFLDRNDYYVSPGGAVSATYYFRESDGVELRAAFFWSHLDGSAQEVVSQAGLYPDAQKPEVLLLAGWRHSLTYGKVALFSGVIHFDVQSGVHAGTLMTDRAATPAVAGSFGVVAGLGTRGFAQFDLALLGSLENRSQRVLALGALPLLSFGWSL